MDTYTIAAAARLVGAPKGTLYQAIRAGRLQAEPRQEPAQALTVTAAALQAAGFTVPATALPSPPPQPVPEPRPAAPPAPVAEAPPAPAVAAAPAAATAGAPEPEIAAAAPPRATPEQVLIAHLERALEQAQARELRLLDLLAQRTGSQSAPLMPVPPGAPPARTTPAAAPHPAAPPPLSGLRQQIVAVLQQHPEGLSPKAVQTHLQLDTEVGSIMKRMVHRGLLTRLAAGRYVVAPGVAHP
jgi:hypothetical protein